MVKLVLSMTRAQKRIVLLLLDILCVALAFAATTVIHFSTIWPVGILANTWPLVPLLMAIALVLSLVWLAFCLLFVAFVGLGDGSGLGPLRFLVLILALLLPVALIWIASIAVKSARIIRDESERLQASMDAMRQIYVSQAQIAVTDFEVE